MYFKLPVIGKIWDKLEKEDKKKKTREVQRAISQRVFTQLKEDTKKARDKSDLNFKKTGL